METSRKTRKQFMKAVVLGLAATAPMYFALFGRMVYHSPLTYAEMDFNHDGAVAFGEAAYASSFSKREISASGKRCIEYVANKYGLPLKVDCQQR